MKILTNKEISFSRFGDVMALVQESLNTHALKSDLDPQGAAMVLAGAMAAGGNVCLMVAESDEGNFRGILLGAVMMNPLQGCQVSNAQLVAAFGDNQKATIKLMCDGFFAWSKAAGAKEVHITLTQDHEIDGMEKAGVTYARKVEV